MCIQSLIFNWCMRSLLKLSKKNNNYCIINKSLPSVKFEQKCRCIVFGRNAFDKFFPSTSFDERNESSTILMDLFVFFLKPANKIPYPNSHFKWFLIRIYNVNCHYRCGEFQAINLLSFFFFLFSFISFDLIESDFELNVLNGIKTKDWMKKKVIFGSVQFQKKMYFPIVCLTNVYIFCSAAIMLNGTNYKIFCVLHSNSQEKKVCNRKKKDNYIHTHSHILVRLWMCKENP